MSPKDMSAVYKNTTTVTFDGFITDLYITSGLVGVMAQVRDVFSDPEERRVLFAAMDSFRQYRRTAHYNVTHRRRQNFYALPPAQQHLLAAPPFSHLSTLDSVDDAIDANATIATAILHTALSSFNISSLPNSSTSPTAAGTSRPRSADNPPPEGDAEWHNTAKATDVDKARSTIRQLYRDWSAEGSAERSASYVPAIRDVVQTMPPHPRVKILVPGAGLGRLVFELCRLGYTVQGNEISYHQLMASNWVLNHVLPGQQYELFPFALDFSNVVSRRHQLRSVKVPDVHPGSALDEVFGHDDGTSPTTGDGEGNVAERMSMMAADFVVLYGDEEHGGMFDAVVTVYFIDTAPNLIRYVETVRNCLRDGGVWINLGPLLWHFADRAPAEEHEHYPGKDETRREKSGIEEPGAFELTEEEVVMLVEKMGFDIEKREIREGGSGYIQNPESMLQNTYRTSHWMAKKRPIM